MQTLILLPYHDSYILNMPTAYKNSFWACCTPFDLCMFPNVNLNTLFQINILTNYRQVSKHAAVPASSPAATITASNTATMMTTLPVMAGAAAGTVSLPSEDFRLCCKCSIVRRCKNNMVRCPSSFSPFASLPSSLFRHFSIISLQVSFKTNTTPKISKEMPVPDAWDPAAAPAVN